MRGSISWLPTPSLIFTASATLTQTLTLACKRDGPGNPTLEPNPHFSGTQAGLGVAVAVALAVLITLTLGGARRSCCIGGRCWGHPSQVPTVLHSTASLPVPVTVITAAIVSVTMTVTASETVALTLAQSLHPTTTPSQPGLEP